MKIDTKFVLITLSIILICCIMFTIKNKTIEKFFDETSSPPGTSNLDDINTADATLNDLLHNVGSLSSVNAQNVTASDLNTVKTDLESKIQMLDALLNNVNTNVKLSLNQSRLNNPTTIEGAIDEKTIQLLQDKEIERLTDRLNKLKTAYNIYLNSQKTDDQPKIPIYSSCIVSEASGAYTTDNLTGRNRPSTINRRDRSNPVPTSVSNNNPFKDANITDSEINFDDILNQLSKSNLNVNVGVGTV